MCPVFRFLLRIYETLNWLLALRAWRSAERAGLQIMVGEFASSVQI